MVRFLKNVFNFYLIEKCTNISLTYLLTIDIFIYLFYETIIYNTRIYLKLKIN